MTKLSAAALKNRVLLLGLVFRVDDEEEAAAAADLAGVRPLSVVAVLKRLDMEEKHFVSAGFSCMSLGRAVSFSVVMVAVVDVVVNLERWFSACMSIFEESGMVQVCRVRVRTEGAVDTRDFLFCF